MPRRLHVDPRASPKIHEEGDVLFRLGMLGLFCPKQSQVFITSADRTKLQTVLVSGLRTVECFVYVT